MTFICEICGFKTVTDGGLRLHMKVTHSEAKALVEPEKPKATVVKKQPKSKTTNLIDSDNYVKKKRAEYSELKKKWRKKSANLKEGDKITKAKVSKLFPSETQVFVNGKMSNAVNLCSKLERSYIINIKEMKNEWIAITLVGKKHSITWKEGPVKNKHKVCIPSMRTK